MGEVFINSDLFCMMMFMGEVINKLKLVPKIVWFATGAAVFVIVASIIMFRGPSELPPAFIKARIEASEISRRIVELTSATADKVKEVNEFDLEGDRNGALDLIGEARNNNTEAYNSAFDLSRNLQVLAESLAYLPSNKSQRLAYEAVAVELSLISEFIVYTKSLNEFLDSLDAAINTDSTTDRDAVDKMLTDVNESAYKINFLNDEFLVKMGAFDESL